MKVAIANDNNAFRPVYDNVYPDSTKTPSKCLESPLNGQMRHIFSLLPFVILVVVVAAKVRHLQIINCWYFCAFFFFI